MTGGGAERVRAGLDTLAALATRVAAEEAEAVAAIADRYEAVLRAGGTLFFAGNGGSAADAQHLATEYVVRYQNTRPALRAVALTTDTSLLTACAGDRIPPPTNSSWSGADNTARHARITSATTGRSAPLPASRYTACIPISFAASACAAASSGLSAGSGRVWLTASTLVTRPPSTRM